MHPRPSSSLKSSADQINILGIELAQALEENLTRAGILAHADGHAKVSVAGRVK
jgi:hypothetical protein